LVERSQKDLTGTHLLCVLLLLQVHKLPVAT